MREPIEKNCINISNINGEVFSVDEQIVSGEYVIHDHTIFHPMRSEQNKLIDTLERNTKMYIQKLNVPRIMVSLRTSVYVVQKLVC